MRIVQRTALAAGAAILVTLGIVVGATSAQASGDYQSGAIGIDLSYPSCATTIASGLPFGIVGVSGGRVDTDNRCARAEASHLTHSTLYVNTGLDTSGQYFAQAMDYGSCNGSLHCGAYWYGFLAAIRAVNYAKREHLRSTTWWLDVELSNDWSNDTALNDASIWGEHQGLAMMTSPKGTAPAPAIGVYARPGKWQTITGGGLKTRDWPVWYATGRRNLTTAQLQQDCAASKSFTAGPVQVVQWIGPGTLNDLNYGC